MRLKKESVLRFEWADGPVPRIVVEHRKKYKAIDGVLDDNPEILHLVHQDLKKLSCGGPRGRKGKYTSESVLRALVVMSVEGLPLRDTIVRIAESGFLEDFVRLGNRTVMDFTFLDKCFKAIRPQTWKRVNELLGQRAVEQELFDPSAVRSDTTVVESNIHYPTDSSLLWDSWRVSARLLRQARKRSPESCPHRFHDKKVKALHLFITRYISSRSRDRRRKVKTKFRRLIARVGWIVGIAEGFCTFARGSRDIELLGVALELERYLPAMLTVVAAAERAQLRGETVAARERVFSIFEPHTELIKRGKRGQPVEFGHKVLLSQTRAKFITDYEVMEDQSPDSDLTEEAIEDHKDLYGEYPDVLAADTSFNPGAKKRKVLEEKVKTLAIPRHVRDWADKLLVSWQAFRAGIEGTISCLKRAFRLARCFFRGFNSFASAVGLGVFCHNLIVLAHCRRE